MLDAIRTLLDAHAPADQTEARHLHTMRRTLERGAAVCSRSWFDPGHFTASAFVLSPTRDSLLLVHHARLKRWLQPGGHLEADDADPVAAARREVLEETGLGGLIVQGHGLFDVDVHEIPARRDEPEHLHLDLRFAFVAPQAVAVAGDGVDAARFVALSDLDAITPDASVRRAAEKLGSSNQARAEGP